jgi:hypothetical protein
MKSTHSRRIVPIARSQNVFAVGVRTGVLSARNAKVLQRRINGGRENRIAVIDEESVRMIIREKLTKLLNRPFRRRMIGHTNMQNAAGSKLLAVKM